MTYARTTVRALVMAVLAAALLAACGDGDDDAGAGGDVTTTTVAPTDAGGGDDAEQAAPAAATVATAEHDLGTILVDGEGRTLYVFLQDEENVSNCSGSCIDNWPPFLAGTLEGEGDVDANLLGTTTSNESGEAQGTYAGRPLYYFAADSAAGDTNGQGVGDVWFVVGTDGEPIQ